LVDFQDPDWITEWIVERSPQNLAYNLYKLDSVTKSIRFLCAVPNLGLPIDIRGETIHPIRCSEPPFGAVLIQGDQMFLFHDQEGLMDMRMIPMKSRLVWLSFVDNVFALISLDCTRGWIFELWRVDDPCEHLCFLRRVLVSLPFPDYMQFVCVQWGGVVVQYHQEQYWRACDWLGIVPPLYVRAALAIRAWTVQDRELPWDMMRHILSFLWTRPHRNEMGWKEWPTHQQKCTLLH
jgi:hypothetical protein